MTNEVKLSDQQYQLVQALTKLDGGSAREVQQELNHLGLAHTTIATVLSRLEKKGILSSMVKGRERIYNCLVDEKSIKQSMVSSLVSTLFKGDPKALMAHLVEAGDINTDELADLEELIRKNREQEG